MRAAPAREPSLRALGDADRELLATATLGNLNWSGERFTAADVQADPRLRHYVDRWREERDFGVVAELARGRTIGVAWALRLPASDPGYGFVDAATPELSLWVAPGHRGLGLGTRLLAAVIEQASERGVPAVSLSVEQGNPARRLYERAGFVHAAGRDAGTLLLRL